MSTEDTNPAGTIPPNDDSNADDAGNATQTDEQAAQAAQDAEDAAKATEAAQAVQEQAADDEKKDTDFDAPELSDDGAKAVSVQASRFQAEPRGKIIDVGDDLEFDGERIGSQVVIREDVYRRYYPRGAKRASYELIFRKGTTVPVTTVENMSRRNAGGPGVV